MKRATEPMDISEYVKGKKPKMARTRIRTPKGEMNKTEAAYSKHLTALAMVGTVHSFWFQLMTFQLGFDCRWTPDFVVQMPDGTLELHDTKGWDTEPAARVKEHVCCVMFPFPVKEVRYEGGKLTGRWTEKVIGPKSPTP